MTEKDDRLNERDGKKEREGENNKNMIQKCEKERKKEDKNPSQFLLLYSLSVFCWLLFFFFFSRCLFLSHSFRRSFYFLVYVCVCVH